MSPLYTQSAGDIMLELRLTVIMDWKLEPQTAVTSNDY